MNIHFSSTNSEWYTPLALIERVVYMLGEIDLDPCSNEGKPNIPARQHFTYADNGLSHPWYGRLYMNPPYGRAMAQWIVYLCTEYEEGRVIEALCLVPARTDTQWFRRLKKYPRCCLWGRLRFVGAENSAPFPSMVVYLGTHIKRFQQYFGDIGDIYIAL